MALCSEFLCGLDDLGLGFIDITHANRTQTLDARGNATYFFYDALDRLTAQKNALKETTYYAYDSVGNRTSMTDALLRTTQYVFDQASRLVTAWCAARLATPNLVWVAGHNHISGIGSVGVDDVLAVPLARFVNRVTAQTA